MSTGSRFSISSLLNYGQPGGATPTPSQPLAATRFMHATGAQFANPPAPAKDEALQKAILEYVSKLSNDDKVAFHSAPDVIEHLQETQRKNKPGISGPLTTRVEKVLQCIKHFTGSLAISIQHHPEISSLVLGGVNCILVVGTTSTCYLPELKLIYLSPLSSLFWDTLSSLSVLLE